MCDDCGCNEKIIIDRSVTEANDTVAHGLWHRLRDKGILCVNIMGAPGSGKTTFIENVVKYLKSDRVCVVQGDLESDIDKIRLEKAGIETYQINTHSGCHLNAQMIETALSGLKLHKREFLFIENVGNLVCPAGVKLGQHIDIVVSSVAEGTDKPRKYPHIFRSSKMVVISKSDLAVAVDFNEEEYIGALKGINSSAKIIKTSRDLKTFKSAAGFFEQQRTQMQNHSH